MQISTENFRKEFHLDTPSHVPMNNAGLSLLTKKAGERMAKVTSHHLTDAAYLEPYYEEIIKAKSTLAKFLDTEPENVAWTPNCSAAISFVAGGLEFSPGEEIVVFENEYPSNFYPWTHRAEKLGSKLRVVPIEKNLSRKMENILGNINAQTKVVAFSHVQSDCGYLTDISQVSKAAHAVGAIVVVDVIQSMGVIPLSLETSGADIFCGGSHKWTCGPLGAGFLAIKKNVISRIAPLLHGALNYGTFCEPSQMGKKTFTDARKFEQGTPSFHSVLGAAASMEVLLAYGVDNLRKKTKELRAALEQHVRELGFFVYGDSNGPEKSGPQISISHSKKGIDVFSQALIQEKITHALRPAPVTEQKVLRLSPHAYNTKDEIDFVAQTLKKVLD